MNNIDKANEHLFDILNNNITNLDTLAVVFQDIKTLLLNTSTEMCELQKQECTDKAMILVEDKESTLSYVTKSELFSDEYYYHKVILDKDSILNCKNVCTT
jgi:hypothetical protein